MDDERQRDCRRRRRHRHTGRGLVVLHLESLGRDRSRPSAGVVLPRHAVRVGAALDAQRHIARAARRDHDRPVQRGVRAARPSIARPGRLPSRRRAPALHRPRHARGHRDRELRRRGGVLLGGAAHRRGLRRPVRSEGGPRPQAGQALGRGHRQGTDHVHLRAQHVHPGDPRRLHGRAPHLGIARALRGGRAAPGELARVHAGDARDRRPRDHTPPPVRPARRTVHAGGAARGVDAAPAPRHHRRRPVRGAARSFHP